MFLYFKTKVTTYHEMILYTFVTQDVELVFGCM